MKPISYFSRKLGFFGVLLSLSSLGIVACSKSSTQQTGKLNEVSNAPSGTEQKKEIYHCPMHPKAHFDHPGECPICHMKLERLPSSTAPAEKPATAKTERKIKFYRNPMDPSIHSDHPVKDSMGMDYVPVYEEESPEGTSDDEKRTGRGAFRLTPEQLKLTGTSEIEATKMDMTATARVPGRVVGGSRVSFQAFEQDLVFIKPGMEFEAESPSLPGKILRGRITSVDSILDPMTRTVRVDGTVSGSSDVRLRTEASLIGKLRVKIQDALSIPEAAVIRAGEHDLVYLSDGNGGFKPRTVTLGIKADGRFEVKSGLTEGEKVSSGPNFLLDSESRIQFSGDDSGD